MRTIADAKKILADIKKRNMRVEEIFYNRKSYKYVPLLRSALIFANSIHYIDNITEEEKEELKNELDNIMSRKFQELNPNLSEDVLTNMLSTYYRGYIILPMDIFVVDDAVINKEGIYNDFGFIYKVTTFMFDGMTPYFDVSSMFFTLEDRNFDLEKKECLTKEEILDTSKFISDSINAIYKEIITEVLNYNVISETSGISVYINKRLKDIGRSLKHKEECNLKICIQNKDDIKVYSIHQAFKDNAPIWNVVNINNDVWRLTEEVLKQENKNVNDNPKLIRKK